MGSSFQCSFSGDSKQCLPTLPPPPQLLICVSSTYLQALHITTQACPGKGLPGESLTLPDIPGEAAGDVAPRSCPPAHLALGWDGRHHLPLPPTPVLGQCHNEQLSCKIQLCIRLCLSPFTPLPNRQPNYSPRSLHPP